MKLLNRNTTGLINNNQIKVLQFGEGNFLRGFVDWILDTLHEKTNFNGAVQVVQPIDKGIAQVLQEQEGLYHLLLQEIQGGKLVQEKRLISCISGAINPYEDYQAYLKLGENPDLEFVISNTTEAGIIFDQADQHMEALPKSFPGKLTALLYHRFNHFNGATEKALTIIPCELIDKNGEALRNTVLQFAHYWKLPESFIHWITEHTIFCSTLVDRIVPGFPRDTIQEIQQELGYEDKLVVTAEPFHLWIIEAPESVKMAFPVEKAGLQVKFVADITPYRTRKVRILNGAHTALVPVAYLHGLRTVREAVKDEKMGAFIKEAIFEEIIPILDLPNEELVRFANDVIERFQNPFIQHKLISIALNSIAKYKVRVLPSVLAYHQRKGKLPGRLLQALAALIIFYRGKWKGEKIPLCDTVEVLTFFGEVWKKENIAEVVSTVLSNKDLWDVDLTQIEGMSDMVTQYIQFLLLAEKQMKMASA